MCDLKINLTKTNIFAENSKELSISKKINFVFGKNGTGKTTIADSIENQLQNDYDVQLFKDFDGVAENGRLNAIALGTENAEIQDKIETIDEEIAKIKKEIEKPEDEAENLFTKAKKADENREQQDKKINDFFAKSAKNIKNQTRPQVAKTNYNKTDFKNEVSKAKFLGEDEIKKHKEIINSEKKESVNKIILPNFDLPELLKSTNEVLQSSVSRQQIIDEFKNNSDKENFAKQGMNIHKNGEKCAFCGNEISEERWRLLGSYFNDEVKKLENRIEQAEDKINSELGKLSDVNEISKNYFYEKFANQIENLSLQIKNNKGDIKDFLDNLKTALEEKKKNLFVKSKELDRAIPKNFTDIKFSCDKIVEENNNFGQNLNQEKENAKDALRYHEIKKMLDDFKWQDENRILEDFRQQNEECEKSLGDKKQICQEKKDERNKLISQTKNENKIAERINNSLRNMAVTSFSLVLVPDKEENQKGQYQIKSHNGSIREIAKLSKGEKNIIAFLYFLFKLEKVSDGNKAKIIILDDPMTSNDDTMQYLMITEIQKFYSKLQEQDFFILLTHNCHFYLNVRKEKEKFYQKYGNFHLFPDGKLIKIRIIKNGSDDFKTNYETLWKELLFLYEENKPDLMLNSCRRILETYINFNCIDRDKFYSNNTNAKKLFDVNSHDIDDLEAEQNGKTNNDIKNILKKLFKSNNTEEHFNNHWKTDKQS
jgi:wobble nucleotide-excising tRNase